MLELGQMSKEKTQARMQSCLDQLGISLSVVWAPNPSQDKHGLIELSSRTLFIFNENEDEAWQTFMHEVFEWKLKDITRIYRETVNGLLEILEKLAYKEKEKFLEAVPNIFKVIEEENKIEA
jgi:excinuclease UvrABC ATPase subunit